ncbi:MAG: hypothetical protein K8M05_21255 [Deltaproteobacteria bacterium]|nr:hypothetical protein [Kofleriaceae bacterium]
MGWFSRIKSAVRQVVRVVSEAVGRVLGLGDLLFGFLTFPRKRLRLHVAILSDANGPLVTEPDLIPSIDYIKRVFKDRFNVDVLPYTKSYVYTLPDTAPAAALDVNEGVDAWLADFGEAGDYFAKHLAGWNAAPVSFTFPVTVYVIRDVIGKKGNSPGGPLVDYVLLDVDGVRLSTSTLAHEVAHACGLWHSGTQSNLMYKRDNRGDGAKGWQKNLLRSSRHVLYW